MPKHKKRSAEGEASASASATDEPRPSKVPRRSERIDTEAKGKAKAEADEYEMSEEKAWDDFKTAAAEFTVEENVQTFGRMFDSSSRDNLKSFIEERKFSETRAFRECMTRLFKRTEMATVTERSSLLNVFLSSLKSTRSFETLKAQIGMMSANRPMIAGIDSRALSTRSEFPCSSKQYPLSCGWIVPARVNLGAVMLAGIPPAFGTNIPSPPIPIWRFAEPFSLQERGGTALFKEDAPVDEEFKSTRMIHRNAMCIGTHAMVAVCVGDPFTGPDWALRNTVSHIYIRFLPTAAWWAFNDHQVIMDVFLRAMILDYLDPELMFLECTIRKTQANRLKKRAEGISSFVRTVSAKIDKSKLKELDAAELEEAKLKLMLMA